MATTEVERIVVDQQRRIKAFFKDGSFVLLSSDGQFYYVVDAEGHSARHLTRYTLRRHSQQLSQVLRFRNLYFQDSFYATWAMDDEMALRQLPVNCVPAARWPTNAERAAQHRSIVVEDGRVYVYSLDGLYRLVYDATGKRVSVRYPLEVELSEGRVVLLEDKVFPVYNLPPCWLEPLQLALDASGSTTATSVEAEEAKAKLEIRSQRGRSLPVSEFREGSWWFRNTAVVPDEVSVALDWTPSVLYHLNRETCEVHAWIDVDGSALETTHEGRFIQHRRREPHPERIYAKGSLPLSVLSQSGDVLYSLENIVRHALALRLAAVRQPVQQQQLAEQPSLLSADIHEERRTVEGVFTAYADGRLRVKFADRTILNLNRSGDACDCVLSHGERRQVPTKHPLGVESYVESALAFRSWAFSSPEQRAAMKEIDTVIDGAVLRCRINAAFLFRTVQKQLPL